MKTSILLLCLITFLSGQGLFESALSGSSSSYSLTGDISTLLLFDNDGDSLYNKHSYAHVKCKLKTPVKKAGYAYAEFSLLDFWDMNGHEFDLDLREAYLDLNSGPFSFRAGKQIEVWGRADVFSPSDNITPRDMTGRFIDTDNLRMGNTLLKATLQPWASTKLQAIWIPYYKPHNMPLSAFDLPDNIDYLGINQPDLSFRSGGGAVKLDLYTTEYDASFSYVNAYALQPGFFPSILINSPTDIQYCLSLKPWRFQVFGFDAATYWKSLNIRIEMTCSIPDKEEIYIPNKEVQWVLGMDYSFRSLSCLIEYNGAMQSNYKALSTPQDPLMMPLYLIEKYNRIFFRQCNETRHAIFGRMALGLFHDTWKIELCGSYDITTEEYFIMPGISAELADALHFSLTYVDYRGPDDTLYKLLAPLYNGFFCKLTLSF